MKKKLESVVKVFLKIFLSIGALDFVYRVTTVVSEGDLLMLPILRNAREWLFGLLLFSVISQMCR